MKYGLILRDGDTKAMLCLHQTIGIVTLYGAFGCFKRCFTLLVTVVKVTCYAHSAQINRSFALFRAINRANRKETKSRRESK